jgi:oxalate decarboxylase/phosphoglucose isomerase-like protein (cupin superfamily)
MFKHEDDRRSLIEWDTRQWPVVKIVTAKCDCGVGDHYHKNKDERFLLIRGSCVAFIGKPRGEGTIYNSDNGHVEFDVPRGKYHLFSLTKGSILLGLASEPFDPADDFKS